MCGIIGIITNRSRSEILTALERGNAALAHRGPDDEGVEFLTDNNSGINVAFGHRRLSILDLSPAGHQPMQDENTGNWITFNGEVFNFREVRQDLKNKNIDFYSDSDTEVILKGFGAKGLNAVDDWRGMFALGIWESSSRRLTLIRDRLGIKPLYYYYDGRTFIFGSEIRALLKTGLVPRNVSRSALRSYLTYGSVQQPLAIIDNVHELLPGHWLQFENGNIKTRSYWDLTATVNTRQVTDETSLVEEVRELLDQSVRYRMVSDVPVGAFLSGGIDSSAVVSLMRRNTNSAINTFSIYFNEQEFSEYGYAQTVAARYETIHRPVLIRGEDILARFPQFLRSMDQPSFDGINSYIVSEATAQAGLKVALSGLGGDEVFAGYHHYQNIGRAESMRKIASRVPPGARRTLGGLLARFAGNNRRTKLAGILGSSELKLPALLLHRQLFTEQQRNALMGDEIAAGDQECLLDEALVADDPINQASILDLKYYLCNTLLRDTDVMSMAHGLEARVPLIDHKLVEYLLSIPGPRKIKPHRPKWLLVEAVNDLPPEIVNRPKQGFEFPFDHWLRNELRDQVTTALNRAEIGLERRKISYLWDQFIDRKISWTRIWSLYVLAMWWLEYISMDASYL